QYKFDDSSGLFDGAGDYISIANNEVGDFYTYGGGTIEVWLRITSLAATSAIFQTYTNTGSTNGFVFFVGTNGGVAVYAREYYVINATSNAGSITINTWHHVALSINAQGNAKLHIDGINVASGTFSSSAGMDNTDKTYIGSDIYGAAFPGNMQYMRRTRGVARYSGNFTPPAAAFDAFGSTLLSAAIQRPIIQPFNPLIFHS
ncbi:MAG: LamG domain-containing protein, partial [Candidatus Competibacter sp.]|nr:LamG domain-containing protein [Candidatus Competibacter sp.]